MYIINESLLKFTTKTCKNRAAKNAKFAINNGIICSYFTKLGGSGRK